MQKYLLGLWIFLLVACQEERLEQGLQSGFLIALSEIESEVETRTAPADLPDPVKTEFKVTIRNQETDKQQTVKWSEEVVPAEPGTYTLTAEFGENPDLGFDQPYYKGEKTDQTVRDGYTKEVSIPCEVANALVSIRIKEEDQAAFEKNFPSAYAKIAIGNTKKEWYKLNESAYFKAGSTLSQLILYKDHEGGELDLLEAAEAKVPKPFQAGDHLIITLGLQGQNGNLSLVVEKAEIKEETISETIPMEWLPRPKVEAEGFEGNQLSFVETETKAASIRLVTAAALQDLKLKFNFEDEQFQSSLQKEKEYILSNAEDKQAIETALGITLPEIGTTDASLDLSPLLAKLQTNAGETTENSIEIDAKANNRWSSEEIEGQETPNLKYTLVCNKPKFTVSAYPGNIWTKEFTMNALMEDQVTEGDFSKLSANMKYQFSTNGESDWTDLGEDLRKADLTPGMTYYIRGVYRGEVCSDPVAVSTYPIIELENGNMEDWDFEITDNERNPITKNTNKIYWKKWFPWKSVSVSTIWNTVNQTTTQDGNAPGLFWGTPTPPYVGCCYVANSGTIPVEGGDAHSGKSALLKTVGWGSGSTAVGDASDIKHVTPAELYLGTYDLPNHQPIYGIDYNSRPTAMKFWCKYIPKSTDLLIAQINILDSEGTIIGRANIASEEAGATDWTERILPIEYTDLSKAPKKMYIVFKSGSLTNTDIMDKPAFGNLSDAESVGSKLYVDDVSLVYDK